MPVRSLLVSLLLLAAASPSWAGPPARSPRPPGGTDPPRPEASAATADDAPAGDSPVDEAPGPCGPGDAEDGLRQAMAHLFGAGVPVEPDRARTLLAQTCALGVDRACDYHAMLLVRGLGGSPDVPGGCAYFEARCAAGGGHACAQLSSYAEDGICGPRDDARSRRYAEQACAAGPADACVALAGQLASGEGGPPDLPRAEALAERIAAVDPGTGLSVKHAILLAEGHPDEAFALMRAACDADRLVIPCFAAGLWLWKHDRDPARARRALEVACNPFVPGACLGAALLHLDGGDVPRAESFAKAAQPAAAYECGPAREGDTCALWAAWQARRGEAAAAAEHAARARTLLDEHCGRGQQLHCLLRDWLLPVPSVPPAAER